MKRTLYPLVAAFALIVTSTAFAQSTPSEKTPPPPTGSIGSDSTLSPPNGSSESNKTDPATKGGMTKPGADSTAGKTAPTSSTEIVRGEPASARDERSPCLMPAVEV